MSSSKVIRLSRVSFVLVLLVGNVSTVSARVICRQNWAGEITCKRQMTVPAKVSLIVGIIIFVIIGMIIILCIVVKRNRTEASSEPPMYQVEENQIQGPPTVREAHYTPGSGPIRVYEGSSQSAAEPSFPRPERSVSPVHHGHGHGYGYGYGHGGYENSQPHTAPATRVSFVEPQSAGHHGGGGMLAVPRTAFVTGGFPRPLYTSMSKETRPSVI